MKMKQLVCAMFLVFTICAGCSKAVEEYNTEIYAMDTIISITVWTDEGKELLQDGVNYLYEVEEIFSTTRPGSEIYELNQRENDGWQSISPEVTEVLGHSLRLAQETNGAFDPSVYPLVEAWGFTTKSHRVPSEEEIEALLPLVGTDLVELDETTNQVRLASGMALDFGGIVKGHAGDMLVEQFRSAGVETAMLSLGGNIFAMGSKMDGSAWNIGIQNPYGAGAVATVAVRDKAVVTSGGYQRYFTEDDNTYWHILDPRTGYPATGNLASVTIISDSGMIGDCLSTALFVMGLDESVAYWQGRQDTEDNFDMVLITQEGEVYITPGIADTFNLSKGYTLGGVEVIGVS